MLFVTMQHFFLAGGNSAKLAGRQRDASSADAEKGQGAVLGKEVRFPGQF